MQLVFTAFSLNMQYKGVIQLKTFFFTSVGAFKENNIERGKIDTPSIQIHDL